MILPLTPIRFLYRAVDLFGKKEGIVCGARRFTYAQYGERAERLATGLKALGVQPGDRVAYLSFNNHQLLEGYYGVPMAQAIVMPLNVRLTPLELTGILRHAGTRVLIFENDFAPLVRDLRQHCRDIERYITINERIPEADLTYDELLAMGRPSCVDFMTIDERSIAELFYTSGSTGTPKGVMLSHRTLYLHGLVVASTFTQDIHAVELHTIPLFHANGWGRPQTAPLTGVKQVLVRRFEPTTVFRLIQEEKATGMSLVPTMANALLHAPDINQYDLSSLQEINVGGAAASVELIHRLEQALPGCKVLAGYGLTESGPVASSARQKSTVTYTDEADRLRHQAMAGWSIPGCEIRVVDAHMNDVPRNMEVIGEVVMRGDNIMDGYYNEPEATAAAMTGAWLHTGDMAVWDEESFIHIVDRKKDIIISGGENISSIEVEQAIFAHPGVFECAVVAAPDPRWGEIPVALVVCKPGCVLTEEELLAFLQPRVAKFKLPRTVQFIEGALPKTGTGKIVKRQLREQFWQGKDRRVQG